MVRISNEMVQEAPQFLNPLREREIDLRNQKIPIIENLGATLDQFDTIDLSDNDITRLDGFPVLKRLKCLFLNNNRISIIATLTPSKMVGLEELVLSNNNLKEFGDIECIAKMENLRRLSLMRNPITAKKNYRSYMIFKIPQLIMLDYKKIKDKERELSKQIFGGEEGEKRVAQQVKHTNEEDLDGDAKVDAAELEARVEGLTAEQEEKIKTAILNTQSLDEIRRLEQILQSGIIPESGLQLDGDVDDEMES
ncbi:hypothetical protein SARC_03167 [Sphaeroforma arctica JP610]|uniref:Uncharacterized protein n=1 Tax=Sphaeroforma arctica JP610 TaxID=667725 RepID=A0A0L0G6K8_9EUKA|nr:hypothetical protein SARC_03167 [Sphaeroforma arctica JP610]KNC84637.1 hypothetical protein SARC_03167 [Sphaeroforma arctica JP610]|eukprot:XP_014158539.1 hypothetical protein SARC_03167 [Sphaeroforma arctica JP610]